MEITPEIQALLDAQKVTLQEGFDSEVAGLKKNVEDWKAEKEAAKLSATIAKQEKDEADLLVARANNDVASVEASWKEKLEAEMAKTQGYELKIKQASIGNVANAFITEYGEGASFVLEAMSSEFKKRLDVRDGEVKVLDPNGNLTANTIEDLKKEFSTSQRYADCIKGTQAIGGGANGSNGSSGAVTLKSMTVTEEAIFANQHPEKYNQLLNQ